MKIKFLKQILLRCTTLWSPWTRSIKFTMLHKDKVEFHSIWNNVVKKPQESVLLLLWKTTTWFSLSIERLELFCGEDLVFNKWLINLLVINSILERANKCPFIMAQKQLILLLSPPSLYISSISFWCRILVSNKGEDRIAVTYFGEGTASEGDFATALNFAATLRS